MTLHLHKNDLPDGLDLGPRTYHRPQHLLALRGVRVGVVGEGLLTDQAEYLRGQWDALRVPLALVQIDNQAHDRRD